MTNTTHLFVLVLVLVVHSVLGQDAECITPDGGAGRCKLVSDCPDIQAKMQTLFGASKEVKQSIYAELHPRLCSFDSQPKFCCSECITPDGKNGIRKHLYNCHHMSTMLITMQGLEYVNASILDLNTMEVCCGPALTRVQNPGFACDSNSALPPDPMWGCCGVDAHGSPNIATTTMEMSDAGIHSFPWSALLEYEKDGELKVFCNGVLISNRYVLTAAQCVTGAAWPPKSVKLGEYDTNNDGPDCIDWGGPAPMCSDGAISVPVESVIAHPEYNYVDKIFHNDIALIRLSKQVNHTDFIRPICLPSANFAESALLQTAGWGKRIKNRMKVKQTSKLLRVNLQSCQKIYKDRMQLWEKQLCAGDEEGRDSCVVQGGGPIAAVVGSDAPHYELAGVFSLGPRECGRKQHTPGVYTSVYRYVDWIRENMQA